MTRIEFEDARCAHWAAQGDVAMAVFDDAPADVIADLKTIESGKRAQHILALTKFMGIHMSEAAQFVDRGVVAYG